MREWQVGDPVGDGNDIGVPDTRYLDYLKNRDGVEIWLMNSKVAIAILWTFSSSIMRRMHS